MKNSRYVRHAFLDIVQVLNHADGVDTIDFSTSEWHPGAIYMTKRHRAWGVVDEFSGLVDFGLADLVYVCAGDTASHSCHRKWEKRDSAPVINHMRHARATIRRKPLLHSMKDVRVFPYTTPPMERGARPRIRFCCELRLVLPKAGLVTIQLLTKGFYGP
jgi:hypothetical protein